MRVSAPFLCAVAVTVGVTLAGCASSAPAIEDAATSVAPTPDELALTDSGGPTGPITEADLPAGVEAGPSDEELAAEAAENRPDVEPGVLAMENADLSFEARWIDGELSGSTGTLEVELGSMVAFSLITDVTDALVIDDLDLAAPTNGDAAQLVFVAEETGLFAVRLRGSGELIAELVVG